MAIALVESNFLSNPLTSSFKPQRPLSHYPSHVPLVSCRHNPIQQKQQQQENDFTCRKNENSKQLAKLAMVAVAAGMLTLVPVDPAAAAKSGGRVGGQAFRSSAPPLRSSGPRINNSRTNVYINPPIAPPLVGGYGYGYGYGGWGWSPFSFFAPGPSMAVGIGGGFDLFILFIVFGAVSAVIRRFSRPRDDEDDY